MRKNAKLVTLLFMVLCVVWSLVMPIGESHDEYNHVRYAQFIWDNHRLPNGHEIWTGQVTEGFQPPLYHTLIAGLIGLTGFSINDINWIGNPRFSTVSTGEPNVFDNRAIRESSPKNAIIKFHLLRLPSVVIAGLTFWWLWLGLSKLFSNESLALASVSVWAFLVQTTHLGGAIGNDMPTACLCALAFLCLVQLRSTPNYGLYFAVAVLLGLSMMTKMTGLFVYGGVGLGLLVSGLWKRKPVAFITVTLLPLLIGGWAVLRSMQVHIPPIESAWVVGLGDGIMPYLKSWLIAIFRAIQSGVFLFIGAPGWGWLPMPGWYYGLYLALVIVAVYSISKRFREFKLTFPYETAAFMVGSIVFFCMTVYWFRESPERLAGRFFYPFMAGPLGILCWILIHNESVTKANMLFARLLIIGGCAFALPGWIYGSGITSTLGEILKNSGPFQMGTSHYTKLIATDLVIVGLTLVILGIGLLTARRWWPRVGRIWWPIVLTFASLNLFLLVFWVKPHYS